MKDSRYHDLIEETAKRGAASGAALFQGGGINRRTFLQGAAFLGACGGVMGFGLAGCTPANTGGAVAQGWKAGTYTANVTGHNAPFTIDVTFSENAITAIDTSTSQESLGVGASALENLSNEIMEYQTLNVDSVTGATLSSMCLQQGVKDCAEQADAAKALAQAPGSDDSIESSYDADVCVIGGGGAGLTAAISAVQAGAKVVVVEKCGITGGSTNVSEGALNAVDPERQQKQGIEDSVELFYETTYEGGHEQGTPELIHYLTDNALDSVHWLESLGVEFKSETGSATGSLGERSHYPATPSGNTYIRAFEMFIADHADQLIVLHETQAKELVLENGAVAGLKAVHRGNQDVTVNAKSIVVATGGFGANVEYRQLVNDGVWADVKLDDTIGCTNIKPCAQGEASSLPREPARNSSGCRTSSCIRAARPAPASWKTSAPQGATASSSTRAGSGSSTKGPNATRCARPSSRSPNRRTGSSSTRCATLRKPSLTRMVRPSRTCWRSVIS